MLAPKKVKYRKIQKGRLRGKATRGCNLSYGDFGLMATDGGFITSRQIEAARIAIMRYIKRSGKLWICIFPDKPIGKKPQETRMGKGKSNPEEWVAPVKPGRILYELQGVQLEIAKEAFRLASHKFPIGTKFLTRGGIL